MRIFRQTKDHFVENQYGLLFAGFNRGLCIGLACCTSAASNAAATLKMVRTDGRKPELLLTPLTLNACLPPFVFPHSISNAAVFSMSASVRLLLYLFTVGYVQSRCIETTQTSGNILGGPPTGQKHQTHRVCLSVCLSTVTRTCLQTKHAPQVTTDF